jgi:hypothetical protein
VAVEGSEDHLAWEARQRRPAAIAAAAAGVLVFIGSAWRGLALGELPRNGLIESLDRAAEPGAIGALESLKVDTYQVFQDQTASVVASSVCVALGYVALGWALTYLAVAARARRPEMSKLLVYLPMVGGILQALATLLSAIGLNMAISDFLGGNPTVDAARDVPRSGIGVFGQLLGLPGGLALALGLILIALNAMRVGLLTRFMGVLGIVTGALQILPFAGPLPVVQSFWLLMLALLFSGRWSGGTPPAWRTGNAEPWPSSAEIREQRRKAAAEARGETYQPPEPPAPDAEPEPVAAGEPSPSASARKRKRKRR